MDEIEEVVSNNLSIYKKFIDEFNFSNKYVKCLFLNAYNHFLAAKILADTGLRCQSDNCVRMGLESEWLGICLAKDVGLSLQWAFGTGDKKTLKEIKQLERPDALRREISKIISSNRIAKKDRDEMYKALSDKSHTKLASCAALIMNPKSTDQSEGKVECIPAGGIKGKTNISKLLSAVQFVQEFAMAELEDSLGVKLLPNDWKYIRANLELISEGGFPNDGNFEPIISSQKRPGSDAINAIALLEAIRKGSFK